MARKTNLDGLIHCDACGEDYSATYKRCPFCGERAQSTRPSRSARDARDGRDLPLNDPIADDEDDYVFDGQDLFDEQPEPSRPVRSKGGKRLASNINRSSHSAPPRREAPEGRRTSREERNHREDRDDRRAPEPINWPRLITFLCSLVIIAAALVIVFTVIYPQLHQTPSVNPSQDVQSSDSGGEQALTGLSLDVSSVTLMEGGTEQLTALFEPLDWSGAVTWTSSDASVVTVSSTGLLTNVNTTGETQRAVVTVTAGGLSAQCDVYCRGTGEEPVVSEPPASDPPASQTPSGGSTVTPGPATIINAGGGLRVRAEPNTSSEILASLFNGNDITVVADAGGGWAEITFSGSGGETVTGYIMYEYISQS